MNHNDTSLESKLFCENPLTGTFRFTGSHRHFCVNRPAFIGFLEQQASDKGLTQSRICFHADDDSTLQLMLVYHSKCHLVRRHVHVDKEEYIHILKGSMTVRIYGESGQVTDTMNLCSEVGTLSQSLFCYLPRGVVHDVQIHDDSVFLETTTGPFRNTSTIYMSNPDHD